MEEVNTSSSIIDIKNDISINTSYPIINNQKPSSTIKSIKRAIEAILDNKIQIKEKPTVTSINIQDKDIFNDPIKFYECIQKEIDYCAYKLSLKKKSTYVQKLVFLHYIMTFLNYQERNYEIYKSNEMKLLFIFIAGVLEKSKIDFDSFKNMSAILHNQIQIEDNKYSILCLFIT